MLYRIELYFTDNSLAIDNKLSRASKTLEKFNDWESHQHGACDNRMNLSAGNVHHSIGSIYDLPVLLLESPGFDQNTN